MMDTEESAAIVQTHLSPIGGQMHLRMAVQRDMRAIGQSHVARHLLAIGENLLLRGWGYGHRRGMARQPQPERHHQRRGQRRHRGHPPYGTARGCIQPVQRLLPHGADRGMLGHLIQIAAQGIDRIGLLVMRPGKALDRLVALLCHARSSISALSAFMMCFSTALTEMFIRIAISP
jgi:hypothetical protein